MKIVLNKSYGGFGLSHKAQEFFPTYECAFDLDRNDPTLVKVVEEMGEAAGAEYSKLVVVEWDESIPFYIPSCEGWESIEINYKEVLSSLLENQDVAAMHTVIAKVLKNPHRK